MYGRRCDPNKPDTRAVSTPRRPGPAAPRCSGESAIQLAHRCMSDARQSNLQTPPHSSERRQRCTLVCVGSAGTGLKGARASTRSSWRIELLVAHVINVNVAAKRSSRSRTSAAERPPRVLRSATAGTTAHGVAYRHLARAEITPSLLEQIDRREERTGHYVPRIAAAAGSHATARTGRRL
eukprot:SAG31_NODE_8681_length_1407_cov_1.378440_1_plen_181_part_00